MLVKLGVDISRLCDPIRRKLKDIDTIFNNYGLEAVVTSTYEGNHAPNSFHYVNLAIDIRTRDLVKEVIDNVYDEIRIMLGPDYDIIMTSTYMHIEYDPKERS